MREVRWHWVLGFTLLSCGPQAKPAELPGPGPAPPVTLAPLASSVRGADAANDAGVTGTAGQASSAEGAEIDYELRVDDPKFTFDGELSHLTWHCAEGRCRARGRRLVVNGKTCTRLGAQLGVNISEFVFGGAALAPNDLAHCREKVAAHIARNRGANVRDTRRPLAANEAEHRLDAYASQTRTLEGGIRFVFRHGKVLLLRPNGQLFEFDRTRRIVGRGEFVEWNSKKGTYASAQVLSPAIVRRCRYASMALEIKPRSIARFSSQLVFCSNDQEEIQLVYRPLERRGTADETAAQNSAFEAPYRDAKRWPASKPFPGEPPSFARVPPPSSLSPAERRSAAQAIVGSVGVSASALDDAIAKALFGIENTIRTCYLDALGYLPELQGQGELYVYFGPAGTQSTAVVQRMSYVDAERFNACVEQSVMHEKYPPLTDVTLLVPFDVTFR